MKRFLEKHVLIAGLATLMLAFPAQSSVNKDVRVSDGATADGASSVNGSVTVGSNATVTGRVSTVNGTIRVGNDTVIERAETVNGSIKIGSNVRANSIETVNGSIRVDANSTVDGDVSAVNGGISLEQGASVADDLSNVNGDIELSGALVGGDVQTTSGDVEVMDSSVIRGDLIVTEQKGWFRSGGKSRKPKIVIGPGSRVEGVLRLEREVDLYISESAQVGDVVGEMSLDDAVRFSGSRP